MSTHELHDLFDIHVCTFNDKQITVHGLNMSIYSFAFI